MQWQHWSFNNHLERALDYLDLLMAGRSSYSSLALIFVVSQGQVVATSHGDQQLERGAHAAIMPCLLSVACKNDRVSDTRLQNDTIQCRYRNVLQLDGAVVWRINRELRRFRQCHVSNINKQSRQPIKWGWSSPLLLILVKLLSNDERCTVNINGPLI